METRIAGNSAQLLLCFVFTVLSDDMKGGECSDVASWVIEQEVIKIFLTFS